MIFRGFRFRRNFYYTHVWFTGKNKNNSIVLCSFGLMPCERKVYMSRQAGLAGRARNPARVWPSMTPGELGEREMCPWAISINVLVIRCSTYIVLFDIS
jgi:hypothetical protein